MFNVINSIIINTVIIVKNFAINNVFFLNLLFLFFNIMMFGINPNSINAKIPPEIFNAVKNIFLHVIIIKIGGKKISALSIILSLILLFRFNSSLNKDFILTLIPNIDVIIANKAKAFIIIHIFF